MKMNLHFSTRRFISLLAVLKIATCVYAAGPDLTYMFQDDVQQKVDFSDSLHVFLDPNCLYDIQGILNAPDLEFVKPPKEMNIGAPYTVWAKLILINNGKKTRNEYFAFCLDVDSSWMYTVKDGRILDEQYTGSALAPSQKSIPSMYHYIPVSIDAGKRKVLYFRLLFVKSVTPDHLTHLSIQPGRPLLHRLMSDYTWHSYYAGFMLSFCLFSLFMFGVFREYVFIYFASLMLFFALYFMHMNGITDAFVTNIFRYNDISLGQLIISGLILSLFLFVRGYIHLKKELPKYDRFFLAYTVFCILFAHIVKLLGASPRAIIYWHNITVFSWALFCMVPAVYLAYKDNKEARVLLLSIGMLFLGVVLYLMSFQNINPTNTWMRQSFQIGTIVFSGILFYGLFDKINTIRSEKRRIEELDRLKSNFFANISHEFRTPLTLMMGPLQQLLEQTDAPQKKVLLEMAQQNAGRQLRLVNQLLDLSRLDAGKMPLQASEEDFIPFLNGIVQMYKSLADQQQIDLKIDCPKDTTMLYFNRDKMEQVFYNLLSNAFKFTAPGGRISIVLKKESKKVLVVLSDTGKGIPEEQLPHVFDRFFQADKEKNDIQEGSGIGLALVKELVELHGGDIAVESKVGCGTRFMLRFPLGCKHLHPEEIVLSASENHVYTPTKNALNADLHHPEKQSSETPQKHAKRPQLLLIEDSKDMRAFIRMRLEAAFYIIEAVNGQDGILKAFKMVPDLIISDVMMPEKNGYEVCQALKTDLRTCHIPVILLTAKAAQEEKLEGLEIGADDYLTKPFDSKELLIRAQNLIQLRRQLRERFAESITLKPNEVTTNSLDQTFLENALQIVESNIANEQFGIDILSREIGMSRPNLNRKFRALINQSTNQFIQSVRLQRAADLLSQNAGTVAEIAFQTGFGSTAYFVKCFKDHFGETPGNYLKDTL